MSLPHGGDLDRAMDRWGGRRSDWLDLSTGINPRAYPASPPPPHALAALPTRAEMAALSSVASAAYGAPRALPLCGAQQAIGLVPMLAPPGLARVLSPTYGEHAAALRAAGWTVEEPADPGALPGADLAVVVNPNNPDGRRLDPDALMRIAGRTGLLVVDESFADPHPKLSLAGRLDEALNILVQRSFGKFHGLAGLRLGFALGSEGLLDALEGIAGPWPVSGPAIHAGTEALRDAAWRRRETARLAEESARLEALGRRAGWGLVGATALFATFEVPGGTQERLAERRVWTRAFPQRPGWLRLGLPADWGRLERALRQR